jgi:O-acetyl-ADP-ribose deacetylase (regulator of RNase III)
VSGGNGRTALAAVDVRVDDLAFFEGEAIVRPVNELLGATTPVMRKLERAAGATFVDTIRPREPLPVGAAVVTNAGELPVDLMIHGVVSSKDEPVSRASVRTALTNALQRAVQFQIGEVAIAPFGLGAGNLDIEECAEVMVEVVSAHLRRASYPTHVRIVAETEFEEQMLRARLRGAP